MATIIKTTSGRWKAVVRKRGWPTAVKTFRLKRDTMDWARHTEDGMVQGTYLHRSTSEKILFSEAIDRYLREVTPCKRPRTQIADHYRARLLREFFGRYCLAAISPDLIASYRDQRLASRSLSSRHHQQTPAPLLASGTVRLELILLSHLFTTALCEWRLGLAHNPVSHVRKPAPGEGRVRRLSESEESLLAAAFAAYPNPMLGWIFRIALETGMRAGEIGSLRLPQVDLSARVILLTDTKNHGTRTVPLTRCATDALRAAIALPTRPSDCDYIFHGQPNAQGRCGHYLFQNAWWKVRNRLGIRDLRFHDLRHEAISRLVEAGLSDLEVASISGHKAMQMLKRYTHLRAQYLVKKLDQLGWSIGKSPTSLRRDRPVLSAPEADRNALRQIPWAIAAATGTDVACGAAGP